MKLYGLKTCDTCRKAIKSLRDAGQQVTYIDVRADGVPEDVLKDFLAEFGEKLVNKRSTSWRNLDETERQSEPLGLLLANPTLMKRPVIEHNGQLYLGWGKDLEAALTDRSI